MLVKRDPFTIETKPLLHLEMKLTKNVQDLQGKKATINIWNKL